MSGKTITISDEVYEELIKIKNDIKQTRDNYKKELQVDTEAELQDEMELHWGFQYDFKATFNDAIRLLISASEGAEDLLQAYHDLQEEHCHRCCDCDDCVEFREEHEEEIKQEKDMELNPHLYEGLIYKALFVFVNYRLFSP
jgi:ubiquitin